jgi:tetratricopeptide (TPR) repeat protein
VIDTRFSSLRRLAPDRLLTRAAQQAVPSHDRKGVIYSKFRKLLQVAAWLSFALVLWADDQPPEIQQAMQVGEASYRKADYETARASYQKAWELVQQTPGDNPVRYDILKRLTTIRASLGQFAEADAYLQLAMNWHETHVGRDDARMIEDYLESATLWRRMKDYDRASAILGRVRDLHVRSEGPESIPVATDLGRLAQIYIDQKKPESAFGLLQGALKIRTKLTGPYDASLLHDLDMLGDVSTKLGDYEDAEDAYRRALIIRESLFGKISLELISSVDGLAYALFGEKKFDEAEAMYHRLIDSWVGTAGNDHPLLALAYDKVAVFYVEQKKFDQAKEAAEHSNAIRAHFLATGLAQEAAEQQAEGNITETKALYHRVLAILDPPNPLYDELRGQCETILKSLEAPKPKTPVKPPPRKK